MWNWVVLWLSNMYSKLRGIVGLGHKWRGSCSVWTVFIPYVWWNWGKFIPSHCNDLGQLLRGVWGLRLTYFVSEMTYSKGVFNSSHSSHQWIKELSGKMPIFMSMMKEQNHCYVLLWLRVIWTKCPFYSSGNWEAEKLSNWIEAAL